MAKSSNGFMCTGILAERYGIEGHKSGSIFALSVNFRWGGMNIPRKWQLLIILAKKLTMGKYVGILLGLLFLASTMQAQIAAEQQQAIDKVFEQWNRNGSPGGSLAIVENGRIIYKAGYGWADLEHAVPNHPTTVFYAGSVSKQFVAFCILLLQEEGLLRLDDDVRNYLPELRDYGYRITLRQMIHHTSGLRDYLDLYTVGGRDYLDRVPKQAMLDLIYRQEGLNFEPGTAYSYCNSGYLLLAELIQRVSGKTLREYARDNIFVPLGMQHSFFNDNTLGLIPNRAFGYQQARDGGFENLLMRFELVGSGGLYTTVEDLARWDRNFYANKLGKGNQHIIDTLTTPGKFNDGSLSNYAFALVNGQYRGLPTISHTGSLGGYRACFMRFPEQSTSIILLGNAAEFAPAGKAEQIADILWKDKLLAPGQASPAAGAARYFMLSDTAGITGKYYSAELDAWYEVYEQLGRYYLRAGYQQPEAIDELGRDPGFGLIFLRDSKRKQVNGMLLNTLGMNNIKFRKIG
jgi:CubicO group peptidase (beta-lactamase class C family)